jgi:hypothetical protein
MSLGASETSTPMILDYEALMADFNHKLITQLRGHTADNEYLETWVPDEDPVKSILNMVEAALSAGLEAMQIRFAASTMTERQRAELVAEVGAIARAQLTPQGNGFELAVSGAGP